MTPEFWIGIGTALIILGTVMVTIGTVRSNSIVVDATDSIRKTTTSLVTQTGNLESINRNISKTAEQINKSVNEVTNQLTSSDSFCYVLASVNIPSNDIILMLVHKGDYPVYDVSVEVRDSQISEQFWQVFHREARASLTAADIPAATGLLSVTRPGTMIPNSAVEIARVPDVSPFLPPLKSRVLRYRHAHRGGVSRFGRAPFLCPGHNPRRRRAQPGSSLAGGHRRSRRAAGLTQASTAAG